MLNSFCGRRNDVSFNYPKQKLFMSKIIDHNKVSERYLIFSTSNPNIEKKTSGLNQQLPFNVLRLIYVICRYEQRFVTGLNFTLA